MLKISSCFASYHTLSAIRYSSHIVTFDSISDLSSQWPLVQASFKTRGYVLLQGADTKISTLTQVSTLFGTAQKHLRNPETGVTDITEESYEQSPSHIASNKAFLPHTDGTYLNGMTSEKGKYFRVGPPKCILLQCIKPASEEGGTSILIDGKKVLHTIIQKDPQLLPALFSPVSILRGNHLSMDLPIFRERMDGSFSIRFSYDSDLYFPRRLEKILARFNQAYLLNEKYRTEHTLQEGAILVIDNLRMLHGRSSFVGERHFRRLWIHDDAASEEYVHPKKSQFLHYESDIPADCPTTKYNTYGRVSPKSFHTKPIQVGIHLSPLLRSILNFHILRQGIKPI